MSLRYRSLEEMPEPMRKRVATKPAMKGNALRASAPRRDEEHEQQVVLINRIQTIALNDTRYAQGARRTFAIPNGSGRTKREGGRLKAEGVRRGVSDIFVALPCQPWAGLFIELKSSLGKVSSEQHEWCDESNKVGYLAVVCRGVEAAWAAWKSYVEGSFE